MDMDQAAVFLAGSILTMLGVVVVVAGIVAVNNLIFKYWKPVRIFTSDSWSAGPPERFAHEHEIEKVAPMLDQNNKK
jgi:hypothetical protein